MGYIEGKCTTIANCKTGATSMDSDTLDATQSHSMITTARESALLRPSSCYNIALSSTAQLAQSHGQDNGTIGGNTCLIQDPYCSLTGNDHAYDGLKDQCVLWDNSCTGDKTLAAARFFSSSSLAIPLFANPCFKDLSPECTSSNPPGRISVFSQAKDWARSPSCLSVQHEMFPCLQVYAGQRQDELLNQTCCGNCKIEVDKVDVYYWPEPNADTSCQSIVGSELSRVDAGATTAEHGDVYWGCTSILPYDSFISSTPTTTFTTAYLATIASLEFKSYLNNPYDETPCGNASTSSLPYMNQTGDVVSKPASLDARSHSLVARDGVSTTVLGDHTL